jgi:2,5-diamino-6-(ribosylamino)-4(3H)-pyrimidinone 5'-phosphate reductase
MSADGKIALPSRVQTSISSKEDFKRVHELRNSMDAILVGIGTVLSDDPGLRVKPEYVSEPKNPIRVLLDSKLRVEPTHKIVNDTAPTLIFCEEATEITKDFGPNVVVIKCGQERVDIERALDILKERGIETLLVEGGEEVIWSFMIQGQFDKITMFVGSFIIGGKTSPTPAGGPGASSLERAVKLKLINSQQLGNGILLEYRPL